MRPANRRSLRFTLKAYATALLTLLGGVALSLELGEWGWFSRSGSLVVVNGIILTSHHIIEHIQQLGRLTRGVTVGNRDWAGGEKHQLIHDDHELRWRNEKYGLYMLLLGTLIWGFGDLIGQI